MLKRKRPDVRPPPSYASASSHPPSQPQPEKAIEKFEASHAEVMRAIKKARVFDQQRLVKKIQEEKEPDKVKGKRKGKPRRKPQATDTHADGETAGPVLNTELIARLERELAVLKTLDMEITARVHLAHAMSRVKGLVDAPGPLPAHLQVAEVLATRSKAARTEDTHNVTSSLYNKPFVRDAVAKAVKEMCRLIGVPDKKEPLKKKDKKDKPKEKTKAAKAKDGYASGSDIDVGVDGINYNEEDDDEIERELAKFDTMLGGDDEDDGSDDDNDDNDDGDDDGDKSDDKDDEDEDAEIAKLRAKYKRALAKGLIADDARDDYSGEEDGEDDFEGFSGVEEEEEDDDDDEGSEEDEEEDDSSESEVEKRPRKRAAAAVPAPGASNFLPSLMGGYVADAGDNSDGYGSDEAQRDERAAAKMLGVVRKNRRGQRARQAIWEKKYKAEAKHIVQEKLDPKPVAEKWDAKRGAVDVNDAPRWLRRKLALGGKPGFAGKSGGGGPGGGHSAPAPAAPKKNENANKQVTGTLHPSWEAARKSKEAAQTAEFKGTKIVFD